MLGIDAVIFVVLFLLVLLIVCAPQPTSNTEVPLYVIVERVQIVL
jgi:hypothetical protein